MNNPAVCDACRAVVLLYSSVYPFHLAKYALCDTQNAFIVENMVLLKEFQLKTKMLKISFEKFIKFVGNDDD